MYTPFTIQPQCPRHEGLAAEIGNCSLELNMGEGQVVPLKMGPIGCPETLVTSYQATLRNIPEAA
jgi:hypothetical protein